MVNDPRLHELLREVLESERSPEEVCDPCPELLPLVRQRLQQMQALDAQLDQLFPQSPSNTSPETSAAPSAAPGLPALPGYEVLEVLGKGGMGVVYKARQLGLNRIVALKMLLGGGRSGQAEVARFGIEAEAVARLQHPGIVQIHETGMHDGWPWFSLEFVAGGSLDHKLNGRPLPPQQAARLIAMLAEAVQAAHDKGILHRDLKPANVFLMPTQDSSGLLLEEGEGQAERYWPKIGDFGLAKLLDEDQDQTRSGAILGTPSFMAPEQAAGQTRQVGPAVDVYALGALLYVLLTGRPPFRAASATQTLQQVVSADPVPPRQLNPATPRDLEVICLKCLRKEPGKRYASARELAKDLERYLRGEPIQARPISAWERGGKWVRRHPTRSALLLLSLVALVAGTLALLWHNAQIQDALTLADQQRRRAETNEAAAWQHAEETRQQLYAADLRLAAQMLKMGNILDLQNILGRQRPASPAVDQRGFEWRYLAGHAQPRRPAFRFPSAGKPRLLAYSPDGRFLIAALLRLGQKSLIHVWDRATGQVVQETSVDSFYLFDWFVSLSPDGATVASLANGPHLHCWDVATGKEKARVALPPLDRPRGLAFTGDSRLVAVGSDADTVRFWDWASGKESFSLPDRNVHCLAIARDGKTAVSSSENLLTWWNLARRLKSSQYPLPGNIYAPVFSHDSKWLVLVAGDGVYLTPVVFQTNVERLPLGSNQGPSALAFSPDDRILAIGSGDGTVSFWDVSTRQQLRFVRWQVLEVTALAFSPDGQELAVGTVDGLIHRLQVNDRPAQERWEPETQVTGAGSGALALAPDGKTLAVAVSSRRVQILDVATGQVRATLETPEGLVTHLVFSSDSRTLATLKPHLPFVRFWDAGSGQLRRTLALPVHPLVLALSPSGKLLATSDGGSDPCCILWDAESGAQRAALPGNGGAVTSVIAFSPDGTILATGDSKGTVQLWDVNTVQDISRLSRKSIPIPFAELRHEGAIKALAFAPAGGWLAAIPSPDTVSLWQLQGRASPRFLTTLTYPPGPLVQLQFAADGQHLLTASPVGCRVWDVSTGSYRYHLDAPAFGAATWWLHQAALSADGKALATTSYSCGIQWWDLAAWEVRPLGGGILSPVRSLAVTPDGRTVISGSAVLNQRGKTQRQSPTLPWLNQTGHMIFHDAPLRRVSDGLLFWDAGAGQTRPGLTGPPTMAPPEQVALSRNGQTLAAGSRDGSAWLWDMQQPQSPRRFFVSKEAEDYTRGIEIARSLHSADPTYPEGVQALDVSPDGRTLALAGSKGRVTLWDCGSGQLRFALPEVQPNIQWLCFSPDGQTLACNADGQVRLWDVQTASLTATLGEVADSLSLCAAFSPDGRMLASGTIQQGLRAWELATRKERTPLVGHLGRVSAVVFAPDGKTLASGSWDRTVRLWSVAAWQEVAVLEGHQGNVTCLTFAPDGGMLLSGSEALPGEILCWRALREAARQ